MVAIAVEKLFFQEIFCHSYKIIVVETSSLLEHRVFQKVLIYQRQFICCIVNLIYMHLIRIFSDCTHIKIYGPMWSSEKNLIIKKVKQKMWLHSSSFGKICYNPS